jgi:hypothetical protein
MKQFILTLIVVVLLPVYAYSQTLIQTFTDPCTKVTSTFSIPLTGSTVIVFYNKSKAFTASDVYSGAFQAWINQVYKDYQAISPCSVAQTTQVATSITANAVSSAVGSAVSSAASSAAGSAASSAASSAVASGGGGSESSSSSGESKSESKSESKGGGGKSGKSGGKSQAKMNPILFNSDLTGGQTLDNSIQLIATSGISQTSMAGDVSWGLTGMVWSNLQQFALSSRYTVMNMNDQGKLDNITNYGATVASAFGNTFGFVTCAKIFPLGKWGVTGANATVSFATSEGALTTTHSLLFFYTKPFVINRRLTISPDVYMSGSPVTYNTKTNLFIVSQDITFLTGAAIDYSITKRFKFNTGLKTSVNTNPSMPILFFAVVGSKINL